MTNEFDWSTIRQRGLNPPSRLTDWRIRQPTAPSTDFSSRFIPAISAGTHHRVTLDLNHANRIVGTERFNWPTSGRATWNPDIREARERRENALNTLIQDIHNRIPSLRQFTRNFTYNPEAFTGQVANWRASTDGWSDQPGNLPHSEFNDTAFRTPQSLNLAVRHEIWRQIERTHPAIYRGQWDPSTGNWDGVNLRRLDAPLRDMEHRQEFALNSSEKFLALRTADQSLRRLQQGDRHWQRLTQNQRQNFIDRYEDVRQDVCRELSHTQFRTHPAYSRICGPVMGSLPFYGQGLR